MRMNETNLQMPSGGGLHLEPSLTHRHGNTHCFLMIELKFCISQAKLYNDTKYFTADFTKDCIMSEFKKVCLNKYISKLQK